MSYQSNRIESTRLGVVMIPKQWSKDSPQKLEPLTAGVVHNDQSHYTQELIKVPVYDQEGYITNQEEDKLVYPDHINFPSFESVCLWIDKYRPELCVRTIYRNSDSTQFIYIFETDLANKLARIKTDLIPSSFEEFKSA